MKSATVSAECGREAPASRAVRPRLTLAHALRPRGIDTESRSAAIGGAPRDRRTGGPTSAAVSSPPCRRAAETEPCPSALAVLAFALALLQRPGSASSDTKIDLHVDPGGFLGDVASAWSSTGDLGHVQGGQYGGYLFPMGPFFALLHALGLGPWLVQRLWLGLILALAAWGAVRLMDEFAGRPRGVAHAVAGLLFLLNPYVVVFSARTTVTLLGYAALPWLLVAVAPRHPRATRAWWAAAFALIVTASGGGVNAAVTAWMLVGPLLLALYERWIGAATWRARSRRSAGARRWPRRSCRPGGSCRCSCSRASASTSCASPSSRGRSGARRACRSRCG